MANHIADIWFLMRHTSAALFMVPCTVAMLHRMWLRRRSYKKPLTERGNTLIIAAYPFAIIAAVLHLGVMVVVVGLIPLTLGLYFSCRGYQNEEALATKQI